jgi:hypothetical protein
MENAEQMYVAGVRNSVGLGMGTGKNDTCTMGSVTEPASQSVSHHHPHYCVPSGAIELEPNLYITNCGKKSVGFASARFLFVSC